MNSRHFALALCALPLLACQETDECKQLKVLKGRYEVAAVQMRARAGLRDQAVKQLESSKARTEALLKKLGLDKSETELDAVLRDRAQALKAQVERGTRDVPLGDDPGMTEKQTMWSFELSAKTAAEAVDHARRLAGSPPLFRYVALLGDGKSWRFRLAETKIEQLDLSQIKPVEPPERPSLDNVPSSFGFCGASELRADIKRFEDEIHELDKVAAETTVAMPKAASWSGLYQRTMAQQAEEAEARVILDTLLTAAVRGDVPIKASGVEGGVVILEMRGGPKERKRFQSQLSKDYLQRLRPAETQRPGLIRYMMVNRATRRHGEEGPGGSQHQGHGH